MMVDPNFKGNVVAQWKQGNCRISICDDYFVSHDPNSPEVHVILQRIGVIAMRVADEAYQDGRLPAIP